MPNQSSAKPNTSGMGTPTPITVQFKKTPSQVLGGLERRVAVKVWSDIAQSMARINLMKALIKEKMGLAELEEFNMGISSKFKSNKMKYKAACDSTVKSKVMEWPMKLKLADEQCVLRELCKERTRIRKELGKKLNKNSRPYRRTMLELKQEELKVKKELTEKFKKKFLHLKAKYKNKSDVKEEQEVPQDLKEYSNLTIFNNKKYEELKVDSYDVKVIGDISLTVEEIKVLQLHPKFCIPDNLQETQFEQEQECCLAKLRMELTKDEENTGLTQEEIQENEIYEAKSRQVFDYHDKKYDARKRRATDLKECARVTLPKPLNSQEEANIEIRKKTQMEIFRNYVKNNTGKNGDQESCLTQEEKIGLKSLQKRISSGEIMIIKTDKSSKLAVITPEKYKELGQEHVSKDKIISRQEVIDMEEVLNGHSRAWANIFGSGKDHKHFERIIASKTTHSENIADLYLMYKDHKLGDKTRPTATGCTSNTLGLSNAVAEVLESVSNSEKERYNTISSEDMLARFHSSNKKIEEINQLINRRRVEKLQCHSCKIMEMVDCEETETHDWETILETEDVEKTALNEETAPGEIVETGKDSSISSTSTRLANKSPESSIESRISLGTGKQVISTETPIETRIPLCTGSESLRSLSTRELALSTAPSVRTNTTSCTGGKSLRSLNSEEQIISTEPPREARIPSCTGSEVLRSLSTGINTTTSLENSVEVQMQKLEQKIRASEKLINQKCCGQEIKTLLTRTCENCGPGIEQEEQELCLIGNDVKALFPSIKSEKTGKIIRTALENTEMEIEGFDVEKALAYIAINQELTTDIEDLTHLLPTRNSGKSTQLKMSAITQHWEPTAKFTFKKTQISYSDKKKIIARVVEIGTRALFQNHA